MPIRFMITKSQELPWFTCIQVACFISLKISQWVLQLCLRPHLNPRSAQKIMGLQSCKSFNFGNFRTPNLGVLGQDYIWVQALWPGTKNNIKGKVVASPSSGQGESYEFMFARGLSVHQKSSNYALTNLLFSLCRFMWIIDPLIIRLNPHLEAPARPSTPEMLRTREHTPTPYPYVFFTLDS